ncbi:MAG: hypothetical protein HW403_148 [Dehalococcoidia bacterium]|nr:hypothetical protein [Dehalococcoidia bacterium]
MRNLTDRKRTMLAAVLVALALIGGVWAGVNNLVSANNIALNTTVFATDYVAAGVGGMRDIGTGSIVVSGVSGTVTKALLYWHGPMNSTAIAQM